MVSSESVTRIPDDGPYPSIRPASLWMVAACSVYLGRPAVRAMWVRYSLVLGAAVSVLPSLLAALLILLPPPRARKQVYDGEGEFAGAYSGRYARVLPSASKSPPLTGRSPLACCSYSAGPQLPPGVQPPPNLPPGARSDIPTCARDQSIFVFSACSQETNTSPTRLAFLPAAFLWTLRAGCLTYVSHVGIRRQSRILSMGQ